MFSWNVILERSVVLLSTNSRLHVSLASSALWNFDLQIVDQSIALSQEIQYGAKPVDVESYISEEPLE